MTLGSRIYAVGGSRSIGSERSIEMFDGTQWQEVGETNGYRCLTTFVSKIWKLPEKCPFLVKESELGGWIVEMIKLEIGSHSHLQHNYL